MNTISYLYTLRTKLFNYVIKFFPDFMNLETEQKWTILMSDIRVISKFGWFIKDAFEKRNSLLFLERNNQ